MYVNKFAKNPMAEGATQADTSNEREKERERMGGREVELQPCCGLPVAVRWPGLGRANWLLIDVVT